MMHTEVGLSYVNRSMAKKITGLTYLGGINNSSKIVKGKKKGVDTYILYLAPHELSGYNVCPMATPDCIKACLNESGHNRIDIHENRINKSRVKKTKLFFEDRNFFMRWLVDELTVFHRKAKEAGHEFAVRLNGTSDIDPTSFKLDGKNILELFPDVQFYDYTKVYKRSQLLKKYDNYDLTFSFSGYNWNDCIKALNGGMRVAVVFEEVPAFFRGWPVINGDETDLRYLDARNVVVGLKFKKVRTKIDFSTQKFVIQANDPGCTF